MVITPELLSGAAVVLTAIVGLFSYRSHTRTDIARTALEGLSKLADSQDRQIGRLETRVRDCEIDRSAQSRHIVRLEAKLYRLEERLEANGFKGEKGNQGNQGNPGEKGDQGEKGDRGENGG